MDVTVDDREHSGISTSDFVRRTSEQLPLLQPIVLVLKRLLHQHGLGNPFSGGLSGYAVTLLAARYLTDHAREDLDLGSALCDMLCFYGKQFCPRTMGVRVLPGESYIVCQESDASCPWACQPVFIEDPEKRGNNVGVTAWSFGSVQHLFADAGSLLQGGGCLDNLWTMHPSTA